MCAKDVNDSSPASDAKPNAHRICFQHWVKKMSVMNSRQTRFCCRLRRSGLNLRPRCAHLRSRKSRQTLLRRTFNKHQVGLKYSDSFSIINEAFCIAYFGYIALLIYSKSQRASGALEKYFIHLFWDIKRRINYITGGKLRAAASWRPGAPLSDFVVLVVVLENRKINGR